MYRANPRVNVELRQRLPSTHSNSTRQPSNSPLTHRSSPVSPPLCRRSVSPVSPPLCRRSVSPVSPPLCRSSVSPPLCRSSVSPVSPPLCRRSVSPVSPPLCRTSVSPVSPPLCRTSVSPVSPPLCRRTVSPVSPPLCRRSVSPVSPPLCRRTVSPVSPPLCRTSVSPVLPPLCRRSVSPARRSVSPPARRSVSPARRSVSPPARRSVSPARRSVSPPARRSVSPARRSVSPPARRSVSPARRSVSPARRSVTPPGVPGQMEVNFSPGLSPPPQAESCGPDGGRTSRDRRHLDRSLDSGPRNLSLLLKELDSLRETNNKLQEELVHREKELQRREVEEVLREEQREADGWERSTGVLEEVLAAQKDRDQALMSRLLLANEERDEALLRARQLQHNTEVVGLEDTDQDVEQLLQRVFDADSALEVQRVGAVLVQRLQLERQRTNQITAQEMTAVMDERNQSLAKLKCLEQEVIQEREQRASETLKTKTELLRLQRERGGALEDQQRLEAELQVLRANHSSLDLLAAPAPSANGGVSPAAAAAEAPPPPALTMQRLAREKQSVEAELQRVQEAEREASERVRRLERLVEVLRKKVGSGSLRAVS